LLFLILVGPLPVQNQPRVRSEAAGLSATCLLAQAPQTALICSPIELARSINKPDAPKLLNWPRLQMLGIDAGFSFERVAVPAVLRRR
jgi:hypothetical protein